MFEEIARDIANATADRRKTAAIQLAVLLNAGALEGLSGEEFCERVGIEPSWKTAYRDMLTLLALMSERGYTITKA